MHGQCHCIEIEKNAEKVSHDKKVWEINTELFGEGGGDGGD